MRMPITMTMTTAMRMMKFDWFPEIAKSIGISIPGAFAEEPKDAVNKPMLYLQSFQASTIPCRPIKHAQILQYRKSVTIYRHDQTRANTGETDIWSIHTELTSEMHYYCVRVLYI